MSEEEKSDGDSSPDGAQFFIRPGCEFKQQIDPNEQRFSFSSKFRSSSFQHRASLSQTIKPKRRSKKKPRPTVNRRRSRRKVLLWQSCVVLLNRQRRKWTNRTSRRRKSHGEERFANQPAGIRRILEENGFLGSTLREFCLCFWDRCRTSCVQSMQIDVTEDLPEGTKSTIDDQIQDDEETRRVDDQIDELPDKVTQENVPNESQRKSNLEEDDDTSKQATQNYDLHENEKVHCFSFLLLFTETSRRFFSRPKGRQVQRQRDEREAPVDQRRRGKPSFDSAAQRPRKTDRNRGATGFLELVEFGRRNRTSYREEDRRTSQDGTVDEFSTNSASTFVRRNAG